MGALLSIDERPAPGLAVVSVKSFGAIFREQLWSCGKARQAGTCDASGERYEPGAIVYRPIGNAKNRSMRILARWIDEGS